MALLAAVSDLHLGDGGDDGSVLYSPDACTHFAQILGQITGGFVQTLVLNGDLFEACVAERTPDPYGVLGLRQSVIATAKNFFGNLVQTLRVEQLVWVPGNHDLTVWQALAGASGSLYTETYGRALRPGQPENPAIAQLFGSISSKIAVAYPNFVYKPEAGWPFAVFTHGHLFDSLVLNRNASSIDVDVARVASGDAWSEIPQEFDSSPWMKSLVDMTTSRITKFWCMNLSSTEEDIYNYVKRRKIQVQCSHRPSVPGYRENNPTNVVLTGDIGWYCNGLMVDEAPVGATGGSHQSYFIKGHTHDGTSGVIYSIDKTRFAVIDLGGWTTDAEEHKDNIPHTHLAVWDTFPGPPTCYALNVGKP